MISECIRRKRNITNCIVVCTSDAISSLSVASQIRNTGGVGKIIEDKLVINLAIHHDSESDFHGQH